MAGRHEYGAFVQEQRAYAEGRRYGATGLGGTNPHLTGSPARIAWDAGFQSGLISVRDSTAYAGPFGAHTYVRFTNAESDAFTRGARLTALQTFLGACTFAFAIDPVVGFSGQCVGHLNVNGATNTEYVRVRISSTGGIVLQASFSGVTDSVTIAGVLTTGVKAVVVVTWQSLDQTGPGWEVYKDGVSVGTAATNLSDINVTSSNNFSIGVDGTTGANFLDSSLGFFWWNGGATSNAATVAASPALFGTGAADAPLGLNGEAPTGTQPLVFRGTTDSVAQWNAGGNKGSGGSFTGGTVS
jgi:hypothetical protein